MFNTPPIRPNGPQVIDPRAAYEQQSVLADQMAQMAQQYTPNSGGLGALAMMLNAYGARKMGDQAQGSLSAALEQENERARAALLAEQQAAEAARRDEYEIAVRLAEEKARIDRENQADPDIIRQMRAAGIDPSSEEGRRRILQGTGPNTVFMGPGNGPFRERDGQMIYEENADGEVVARPIRGTDAYRQRQAEAQGQQNETNESAARMLYEDVTSSDSADNINAIADDVLTKISPWSAGAGSHLAWLGGTPAAELAAAIRPLQSEQVTGKIEEMKGQSQTGATGFGALNGPELNLLLSAQQALDTARDPQELKEAVENWRVGWNVTTRISELTRRVEAGEVPIDEARAVADRIRQEGRQQRAEILERYSSGEQQPAQGGSQVGSQAEEILRGLGI